jgi:HlyD family secretion protein
MPRRSLLVVSALAVLLLGTLTWWFTRIPVVPALELKMGPLVRTLRFSARLETASRVDVGSTVTGRVRHVAVIEGALVRKGDVLVRLESEELQAALAQAQASERQAAARLQGLRSTGRSSAQAAVAQTASVLVAAQAELERTRDLVAKGFVSEARLDEARRGVAVAQAQLEVARAQSVANDEQGTDIAQAEAQLAQAVSAIAAARARLEQTLLTAPADARVLLRSVEPGQIVQPGRALLSLALAGPPQLVAQVDERFLEQLRVGQNATVLADAFPEQAFAAQVQTIAPLVDAQRGAIEVKFSLGSTPPDFLREDMTLSMQVETARRERALAVPMQALRGDASATGEVVHIERDGRVEARSVRLGLRTLDVAEVLDGLVEGDKVLLGDAPAPGKRVRAGTAPAGALAASPGGKPSGRSQDAGAALTNAMGR